VRETAEDMTQLQALLDQSIEQAGAFLRESFQMPDHSLSAAQLVTYLQGLPTVALATVTARSEPRVAPIGALFYRGNFYIPTVAAASRTKHILRNSAVSLTHYASHDNDLALIAHGQATIILSTHPDFAALEELHRSYNNGKSVSDWGEGVFLRITPHALYTYARQPETMPAS